MSLVRIENVTKSFSGTVVLNDVSFRVEEGEKIGLIGRNGTGKSTVFRLITGETQADSGVVERMRRASIACLSQMPQIAETDRIFDTVMHSFDDLLAMERELAGMEDRMGEDDSVLERYGRLQEEFQLQGGYEFRTTAKRVLHGLGFSLADFDLPFKALSGGQRTRLMLALVLLKDADLLLLDEPENHLDMDAREWLEGFVKTHSKAVVIISHDRRMLNEVVDRLVEVERGQLVNYTGNYDYYLKQSALVREQQKKAFNRQQELIEKQEKFITRFRYKATKAAAVQSRVKQLEKLKRVDAPPPEASSANFNLGGEVVRSGQVVLHARELAMAYEKLQLYSDVSFEVERGERIGIVGPNGSGKTTLLSQLAGRLPLGLGEVRLGHKVTAGFYDQHHQGVCPSNDILDEVQSVKPNWRPEQLRSFLGRFLFTGEDVFKRVDTLSGGELSRVAIAKLVLGEANLLLLDEPTNHLDLASREVLEQALMDFPGTLIIVSHDRVLIDRLSNRLLVIENGHAQLHLGNYSDYRRKQAEAAQSNVTGGKSAGDVLAVRKRDKTRAKDKASARDARRLRRAVEDLEASIAEAEQELQTYDELFAKLDPAAYDEAARLKRQYEQLKAKLEDLYGQWEEASNDLAE